ncbi:carotenoid 1,2-hydratase [Congregibacter litoralis]|uniref:Hydroxyneurosporene synthase n=1 Tax=Congregibacter litoralis KT71 TaxID=314285 RepID=A4ACR6_9GAMM|nr:carotenoid 1,2-hydratase [Congregibacter litoralis]EAQ96280.1 hydroxyneurosporene synthase [Congregibacter litoralis KT71]
MEGLPPRSSDTEPTVSQSEALPSGYSTREPGINFAEAVADNGYLWWYVDAISDDGRQAITMIIFVGSVFSPYYARARRKAVTAAENHCAFNTILYGPGGKKRWSMTERGSARLKRRADSYALGPSRIDWDGESFLARVNERCTPFAQRMQGTIRITPSTLTAHSLQLDEDARHHWNPIAPIARVDVDLPSLGTAWSGDGYLDSNRGTEPLADGFSGWDWTRARLSNGDCAVRYEARHGARKPHRLALRFKKDGSIASEETRDAAALPRTGIWRVHRRMPGAEARPTRLQTLEDTPFYARSLIKTEFGGETGTGIHESLSMERFEQRWVQTLLPFRMPRRT